MVIATTAMLASTANAGQCLADALGHGMQIGLVYCLWCCHWWWFSRVKCSSSGGGSTCSIASTITFIAIVTIFSEERGERRSFLFLLVVRVHHSRSKCEYINVACRTSRSRMSGFAEGFAKSKKNHIASPCGAGRLENFAGRLAPPLSPLSSHAFPYEFVSLAVLGPSSPLLLGSNTLPTRRKLEIIVRVCACVVAQSLEIGFPARAHLELHFQP